MDKLNVLSLLANNKYNDRNDHIWIFSISNIFNACYYRKKNVEESKTESKTESKNESQDESKTDSEDEEDSITSKSHPSGEGMHQDNIVSILDIK